MAGEQDRIDIAQAAAQQLREVGIHCTVDIPAKMDWGGQQACLIGWGSPFDADDHTYKGSSAPTMGANYSGYSNEKVDEYLTKARESSDPAVRKEYYDLFQIELANDPAYASSAILTPTTSQAPACTAFRPIRSWDTTAWASSGTSASGRWTDLFKLKTAPQGRGQNASCLVRA